MKKILALVMTLILVVCATAALAEDTSIRNPDIAPGGTVVEEQKGTTSGGQQYYSYTTKKEDDGFILKIIPNTEETQPIIDTFSDAFNNGDVLAAFPDEIRNALPEELTKINEMVTAIFVGNVEKLTDEVILNIAFETPYEGEGEKVVIIFGKLVKAGEEIKVEWIPFDAVIQEDGSIEVQLTKVFIKEMMDVQPFILAVVSK